MLAATGKNATYEVSVYTGNADPENPMSGRLAATASGTKAYPGYVTASLNHPVALAEFGRRMPMSDKLWQDSGGRWKMWPGSRSSMGITAENW